MPTIELNCLVHGNTPDITNIFSVELDSEMTVNMLKMILKEKIKKMKQYFAFVDNKLNIFFDNPNANIETKLGGKRLFEATNKISKHFPYELDKKYIHIMVELPGYYLTLI
ncbi:7112_t:CDS:2, partial [Racocetra fulgida]